MPPKPSSLNAIQEEIKYRKFRVRNLGNLQDLIIVSREDQEWMFAVNIDNGISCQLNAERKQFILLSTAEELELINDISQEKALQLFTARYRLNETRKPG